MRRAHRFLGTIAALLALAALSGCGSSASGTGTSGPGNGLQGLILRPQRPAPPLALHSYTGKTMDLAALQGKAVLVTFVYTHCPDVCPLIISNLAAAARQLGAASRRLRILAVTVDPRRDTPRAIRTFLTARGAVGSVDYLLGPPTQLRRVWRRWDVGVTVDTKQITTGHSSVIYGITASGRMAVVYAADTTPAQLAHDVPVLAHS